MVTALSHEVATKKKNNEKELCAAVEQTRLSTVPPAIRAQLKGVPEAAPADSRPAPSRTRGAGNVSVFRFAVDRLRCEPYC
ncbi:jg9931 [Pararge aegeria aegeria]|uniref:Jg9931 protein n=1 Tax=Pararge aegeria aegeria TaxID=348720 RepID=A0A8S4SBL9_9NEOP|nr:jg9931 [Pararge aegeria aegeria]